MQTCYGGCQYADTVVKSSCQPDSDAVWCGARGEVKWVVAKASREVVCCASLMDVGLAGFLRASLDINAVQPASAASQP